MRRLALTLFFAFALAAQERGKLVENVPTRADAAQTYTLYLPTTYAADRTHPLLLVFDPRGRGTSAAELFRGAAEEFGWIVLSANGTRSDEGAAEHNEAALRAILPEVERYAPDPARIYAAGFSGTAMLAWRLGTQMGGLAGVIGVGGRLVDGVSPEKFPFAWYGFSGDADFNNREMRVIDAMLEKAGKRHRLRQFPGEHRWMPEELVSDAFGWFELMAMKDGKRTRGDALIARLHARDLAAAAAAPTPLEALRVHRAIASTYEGLADVSASRAAIARLEGDAGVKRALEEEAKWDRFEEQFTQDVFGKIGALYAELRQSDSRPIPADITRGFRIAELRRHAAQPGAEGMAGRRLLEAVFGQLAHYLPNQLMERKEYALAAVTLTAAAGIHPDRWTVWYALGAAQARAGDRRQALESVEKAISLGFKDAKGLAGDEDYASIRENKRFQTLLEHIK